MLFDSKKRGCRIPLAFSDSLTDRSLDPHSPINPSLTDPSLTPVPRSTAPLPGFPNRPDPEARLPRAELPDPDPLLYLSPREQLPAQPWIPNSPW